MSDPILELVVPLTGTTGRQFRAFLFARRCLLFEVPEEERPWKVYDLRVGRLAECPSLTEARKMAEEWSAS